MVTFDLNPVELNLTVNLISFISLHRLHPTVTSKSKSIETFSVGSVGLHRIETLCSGLIEILRM